MQLLTNELRQALPPLGAGDDDDSATALVMFHSHDTHWKWFASEFDGDDIFFGVVDGFEVEYGYFSLSELAAYRGRYGAPIERDPSFTPKRLQEIYLELRGSRSIR
jgi:hypothetical protein